MAAYEVLRILASAGMVLITRRPTNRDHPTILTTIKPKDKDGRP